MVSFHSLCKEPEVKVRYLPPRAGRSPSADPARLGPAKKSTGRLWPAGSGHENKPTKRWDEMSVPNKKKNSSLDSLDVLISSEYI